MSDLRACCVRLQGRVLIADSWFGSVPCAKALFSKGIFSVMNVKTAHKGFPKSEMMAVVGEIKGASEDARARRRARRGKKIAFTMKTAVGGKELTLLAAGHNKKVPLLLIATHGTMLPAQAHVKKWRTPTADGGEKWHKLVTPQTYVHKLYRENMNAVDVHNKLRQGVCAMADIWKTKNWVERHFAELLGFLEVNMYLSLTHFLPEYRDLSHPQFRKQLAWALMTLGKVAYPSADDGQSVAGSNSSAAAAERTADCSATDGIAHAYVAFDGGVKHTCAYCGNRAYQYCFPCQLQGLGTIAVCGRKTHRDCIDQHARGKPQLHSSWSWTKKKVCPPAPVASRVDEDDESSSAFASAPTSSSQSVTPASMPPPRARKRQLRSGSAS